MSHKTRVLAGVTVPDTPLIAKAIAFSRQHLNDDGFKHIMRSWLVGQLIISRFPAQAQETIDLEAFAVASIFHDLGWSKSPELISKDKTFEVDGANAAREFLRREAEPAEWDKHRLQLVWDMIALHTTPWIAAHKEIEVALANAAILTELVGLDVAKAKIGGIISMSQDELDLIAKEFPREGLRGFVKETTCGLCREKPETTYWNFQSGFGERYVEGYSLEGKKSVDVMMAHMTE